MFIVASTATLLFLQAAIGQSSAPAQLPDYEDLKRCYLVYSKMADDTLAVDADRAQIFGDAAEVVAGIAVTAGSKLGKSEEDVNSELNGTFVDYSDDYPTLLSRVRAARECDRKTGISTGR